MVTLRCLFFVYFIGQSYQINNGLGRIPQMGKIKEIKLTRTIMNKILLIGWNSWNHFHCNINEKLIQQTADMIVATGLAAAGYQYGLAFYTLTIYIVFCFV